MIAAGRVQRREGPCKLYVEGDDDKWAIQALFQKRYGGRDEPSWSPEIHCCEGFENLTKTLKEELPTIVKNRRTLRLGVVVDADNQPVKRWEAVRKVLREVGIEFPELPSSGELVAEITASLAPLTHVGLWVMPGQGRPGELEHLLCQLVPAEDPVWRFAMEATAHACELGARVRPAKIAKANIHTWLAWQHSPGDPFGTALRNGSLNPKSAAADAFVDWFYRVFDTSKGGIPLT